MIEGVLTELLYCTSMRIRCDRCLESFCIILAKLIVEKKLRHENSVNRSTSSTCFCPFGRVVVRCTASPEKGPQTIS